MGLGEEALGAAEVEDLGGAGQDRRQDPGAAGEPPGLGGGDPLAGVDAGRAEPGAELVVVEGDHHGGGDLAVQPVGGQVLEHLDERLALPAGPVRAGVRAGVGAGVGAAAARGGELLDGLAEDRPGQGGDREVPGHGAVVVVVQGEPGPLQGGGLLLSQQGVLVGVDHRDVALDDLQGPARGLAEPDRVEPLRLGDQGGLDPAPVLPGQGRGEPCGWCAAMTVAWAGERAPGAEGGGGGGQVVVQGGGQPDLAGRVGAAGAGVYRQPGAGAGHPGVQGDLGLVGRGEELELQRLQPGDRAVAVGDHAGVPARGQRCGDVQVVEQVVDLAHRDHGRVAGVGVEVQER